MRDGESIEGGLPNGFFSGEVIVSLDTGHTWKREPLSSALGALSLALAVRPDETALIDGVSPRGAVPYSYALAGNRHERRKRAALARRSR